MAPHNDEGCCANFFNPDHQSTAWKVIHVLNFALGGTTFIAGTSCYFFDDLGFEGLYIAAILYIVGSIGFLGVDVQEFFTYKSLSTSLAINIFLSMVGSTLYIVGSVGFLPQLNNRDGSTNPLGIWGFILGSFFIGYVDVVKSQHQSSSQVWKVLRIGTLGHQTEENIEDAKGLLSDIEVINESLDEPQPNVFKCGNYFRNLTSLGVELSACFGIYCVL